MRYTVRWAWVSQGLVGLHCVGLGNGFFCALSESHSVLMGGWVDRGQY